MLVPVRAAASFLVLVLAACGPRLPSSPPETQPVVRLSIASWNLERLGHGDKDLDAVARILDDFDLVAVQEVMTHDVVDTLLDRLPDHEALLTDTPTPAAGPYREYFAFFYRSDHLDPVLNTFVADPDDRFRRDPYLACFEVASLGEIICLVTFHIVWGESVGERKREVMALDDALRWAQDGDPTSKWVVLGDCNRPVDDGDPDRQPEEEWQGLLDRRHLRAPVALAGLESPTTLGKTGYANAYDHIFVSDELASTVSDAGRVDIVAKLCGGNYERCRASVSDHAPVFVEVTLSGTELNHARRRPPAEGSRPP